MGRTVLQHTGYRVLQLWIGPLLIWLGGSPFPSILHAEPVFYLSPQSLSWEDLEPDRPEEVAPFLDLGGEWEYRVGNRVGNISVPSCYSDFEGEVIFTRQFFIPEEWRDRALILKFFGIRHRASFRLNGALLGSHPFDGLPFELPVPDQVVKFGSSNELTVAVDNEESSLRNLPLRSSVFGPRNFGGIHREVFLQALPRERINSIRIGELKQISVGEGAVANEESAVEVAFSITISDMSTPSKVDLGLFDADGNRITSWETLITEVPEGRTLEGKIHFNILAAQRWKPGRPYLYRLLCRLSRGEVVLDQVQKTFGLSPISQVESNFERSGRQSDLAGIGPLQGIVWVEQWAQSGISPSKWQMDSETSLLMDSGLRLLRCAYFPPHPYFLNLCDSLGIGLFLEIPLFGVSTPLLHKNPLQRAAFDAMRNLQNVVRDHPCVMALGWGSGFEASALEPGGIIDEWSHSLDSEYRYYAQSNIPIEGTASVLTFAPISWEQAFLEGVIPEIALSMGSRSGTEGDLEQVRRLVERLSQLPTGSASFFLRYLKSWYGDRPLILNPPTRSAYLHAAGLTDSEGHPKAAYFKLKEFLRSGVADTLSSPEKAREESPWEFLVVSIALSAFGLWVMRIDKLFRQNLRRAMAHSQRFFSDIRDRRFLQGSQTGLMYVLLCVGIGNFFSSLLFDWRLRPGFSALMEHLVGNDMLLATLRTIIWIPYRGILTMSLGAMVISLLATIVIRFGASRGSTRLALIQAMSLLCWSGVPALVILPLSGLYLRLMDLPPMNWIVLIAILLGVWWSYMRLINALSITYRSGYARPLVLVAGLPLLLLIIYMIRLQVTRQTLDYIGYFIGMLAS